MKNVDVPLWDKGDDTDDFSKGGVSAQTSPIRQTPLTKSPAVKKIYNQILGRDPSSREMAYYKYSSAKKEDIIKKLLGGEEHNKILEKAKQHPDLLETNSKLKSTVLKLKSKAKDRKGEFEQLSSLLNEKNEIIKELRKEKSVPYISNEEIFKENNVHYSISRDSLKETRKEETFWDRLRYLIMGE